MSLNNTDPTAEKILAAGAGRKKYPEMSEITLTRLEETRNAAKVGGYCHRERNAIPEGLEFEPGEVDLSLVN